MANRRFEMYHYRQALVRMRQGESDRQIHATGLMVDVRSGHCVSRPRSEAGLILRDYCHRTRNWLLSCSGPGRRISTHNRASNPTGIRLNNGGPRASTAPPSTPPLSVATGTPAAIHPYAGFYSLWQRKRRGSLPCLSSPPAMQHKSISARATDHRRPYRRSVQNLGVRYGARVEPTSVRRTGA